MPYPTRVPRRPDAISGRPGLTADSGETSQSPTAQLPSQATAKQSAVAPATQLTGVDHEPMPIIEQDVSQIAEDGTRAAFAIQLGIRVRRRSVGLIGAPLAVEIDRRIAWIIRRSAGHVASTRRTS